MDFNDSPEEAAYRAKARAWLEAHARRRTDGGARGMAVADGSNLDEAKEWQALKADAGYAGITIQAPYGAGGTPIEAVIYRQEEGQFEVPFGVYEIGLGMAIPTVIAHGSDAHRDRYVRKALRGEEIWCQLFSEPAGGSDLAALRTKGVRDGDDWLVTGQKVWTSGAHYADYGILLVRTDPSRPKHKGLTMFIVDMKAPGVEVRPIRTMAGSAEFNEVFFDNVRIPDSDRLGEVGNGWNVAISTLMTERMQAGMGFGFVSAHDVLRLARRHGQDDARVTQRVADFWINDQALKLLSYRAQTSLSQGGFPGPEQAVNKAIEAAQGQQAAYFCMDMLGAEGALAAAEIGEHWAGVETSWMWASAMRIAGGSDEILRNIIAERVLGLPGDPRPDRNTPFNELKH